MNSETEKKLAAHFKKEAEARSLSPEEVDFDPTNTDFLMIKRKVQQRKGSWWQLPKDLKISDEK